MTALWQARQKPQYFSLPDHFPALQRTLCTVPLGERNRKCAANTALGLRNNPTVRKGAPWDFNAIERVVIKSENFQHTSFVS